MLVVVCGLGVWWVYSGSDVARYLIFAAMALPFCGADFYQGEEINTWMPIICDQTLLLVGFIAGLVGLMPKANAPGVGKI